MNEDILHLSILTACFLTSFGIAELGYHVLKVKAELTRKFVHVVTGFLSLLFPVLLDNHWLVLLLCSSFAALLILSLRLGFLQSINAIDRKSAGSLAYPVSVYLCYLAFDHFNKQHLYFYLPILTLAICDPIAALTGKRWPLGKYTLLKENKTLLGSSMFLLSSCLLSIFLLNAFTALSFPLILAYALFIALVSCIAEAITGKGYDNISIPLAVLTVLAFIQP